MQVLSYRARRDTLTDRRASRGHDPLIGQHLSLRRADAFIHSQRELCMNKDQVKGKVEQVKGAVKEVAGKVTGNTRMEVEGKVAKVSGKIQAGHGDAKEKLKDLIDKT